MITVSAALATLVGVGPSGVAYAVDQTAHGADEASLEIVPPSRHPIVGERLAFQGRWMGIPVGHGSIEVKGMVEIRGRSTYHIEVQGHTNDVLSTFYPIHDEVHSYIDAETLLPLRYEKNQREGKYRAHEIVDFDHERHVATYHSLLNDSTFDVPIPDAFQDLLSTLYWVRSQPLTPGQSLVINIYTDEKIYETEIRIGKPALLELLKRGTFAAIPVEPNAKFKGLLVKRARIWAYFTTDARRLPLMIKASTPWGQMSAVIEESSLNPPPESTGTTSDDADRGPAGP